MELFPNCVGGHCRDKAIVEDCGILQLLEEGDSVMVDRGFEIQDLLAKKESVLEVQRSIERRGRR